MSGVRDYSPKLVSNSSFFAILFLIQLLFSSRSRESKGALYHFLSQRCRHVRSDPLATHPFELSSRHAQGIQHLSQVGAPNSSNTALNATPQERRSESTSTLFQRKYTTESTANSFLILFSKSSLFLRPTLLAPRTSQTLLQNMPEEPTGPPRISFFDFFIKGGNYQHGRVTHALNQLLSCIDKLIETHLQHFRCQPTDLQYSGRLCVRIAKGQSCIRQKETSGHERQCQRLGIHP